MNDIKVKTKTALKVLNPDMISFPFICSCQKDVKITLELIAGIISKRSDNPQKYLIPPHEKKAGDDIPK